MGKRGLSFYNMTLKFIAIDCRSKKEYFIDYINNMEQFILDQTKKVEQEYDAAIEELEKNGTENVEEEYKGQYEHYVHGHFEDEFEKIFRFPSRILYNSTFVSIISYFEITFKQLAAILHDTDNPGNTYKKEKLQEFINTIRNKNGIDIKKYESTLNDLCVFQRVRHIILHYSEYGIDEKKLSNILVIASRYPSIDIDQNMLSITIKDKDVLIKMCNMITDVLLPIVKQIYALGQNNSVDEQPTFG